MKAYRRFIRIAGELVTSPRFSRKADAEEWYREMRRKKQFLRDGLIAPTKESDSILVIDFARDWIKARMTSHPMATWQADEQRLRDYVLPIIGDRPMNQITAPEIKNLLLKVSEVGYLKPDFKISIQTRTRIKALLSSFFSDALNAFPPVVNFNPVLGIKFADARKGNKKPEFLSSTEECLRFLVAAIGLGWSHYAVASTFLMTGLRKQELIPLRWDRIDFKHDLIRVTEKFEQASGKILPGTKAGSDETREVPMPRDLKLILSDHRKVSKFGEPSDFVFCDKKGQHLKPRYIWQMIVNVAKQAEVKSSPHKLRHTYGREFVANTGNIKALQAILGHASSQTTDIYSGLSGDRLKPFTDSVSFDIGVKKRGG